MMELGINSLLHTHTGREFRLLHGANHGVQIAPAHLVGLEVLATRPRGKPTHLGFLDALLGLTALAVQIDVQGLGFAHQIGHHVAGAGPQWAALKAGDHAAL